MAHLKDSSNCHVALQDGESPNWTHFYHYIKFAILTFWYCPCLPLHRSSQYWGTCYRSEPHQPSRSHWAVAVCYDLHLPSPSHQKWSLFPAIKSLISRHHTFFTFSLYNTISKLFKSKAIHCVTIRGLFKLNEFINSTVLDCLPFSVHLFLFLLHFVSVCFSIYFEKMNVLIIWTKPSTLLKSDGFKLIKCKLKRHLHISIK